MQIENSVTCLLALNNEMETNVKILVSMPTKRKIVLHCNVVLQ
jgi:hypothetical protein